MIVEMGALTGEAIALGMPVFGMIYPRGANLIVSDDDKTGRIAHAARVAWELDVMLSKSHGQEMQNLLPKYALQSQFQF